jgi:uncharacterized membrane protein YfcA
MLYYTIPYYTLLYSTLLYSTLLYSTLLYYALYYYMMHTQCGYRYVDGDVEWSPAATVKYPSLCFFAGFFAGLFGIGGGIVKG